MPGYVYLLINHSMPGLVKVGLTTRDPESRTRELSAATGVPTPFVLVFDVLVPDCIQAEHIMHEMLSERGYRVSENREFFAAPIREVIGLMLEVRERMPRMPMPARSDDYEAIIAPSEPEPEPDPSSQLDDLIEEAARVIVQSQHGSVSLLQRKLSVCYTRAARIVDQLEELGIVGPFEGSRAREVLVGSLEELEALLRR